MQDLLSVIAVGWHQRLELAQNEQQPSSLSALDRGTGGPLVRERAWGGLRAGGAKEMRLASPPFRLEAPPDEMLGEVRHGCMHRIAQQKTCILAYLFIGYAPRAARG